MSVDGVIDLSHYNSSVDFARLKSAGILGVIHKATEGVSFADPMYAARQQSAAAAGLLWGAYHFGTVDDPEAQARFFLERVGNQASLIALDYETNPTGASMTLAQARAFVACIHTLTGRWPGIYGGAYLKQSLDGTRDAVLSNCWLWLAEYAPAASLPPGWGAWTLWQYTDSAQVAGVGACDRSWFNGTAEELAEFWSKGRRP